MGNSKARVGVLTFLHTLNYGAILQSYALACFLKHAGYDATQIDYRNAAIEAFEFKRARTLKAHLANVLRRGIIERKSRGFESFRRDYIPSTAPVGRGELPRLVDELDYVVVGSDQVWNGKISDFDPTYFLDFVEDAAKKKTYAVSIGYDELPEKDGIDYGNLIGSFGQILARERTAAKALKRCAPDAEVDVVVDPTLLLERGEWLKLVEGRPRPERRPYVFVYAVGEIERTVEAARSIAGKRGLEVVVLQQNGFLPIRGVKNLFDIDPIVFLVYLANAELVVTSSFHGLCLSLQFERDFFVSCSGGGKGRSSRLLDLLSELEIEGRDVDGEERLERGIDWRGVERLLEALRRRSASLLLDSLS